MKILLVMLEYPKSLRYALYWPVHSQWYLVKFGVSSPLYARNVPVINFVFEPSSRLTRMYMII